MENLRKSALYYAEHFGWRVFPLLPREKTPAIKNAHPVGDPLRGTCKGECGRLGHGCNDATTDPAKIETWWQQWPGANVGIATGKASGIFILDIDKDHGGFESLDRLIAAHSSIEHTPETITGTGGNHVYFRYPASQEVHNSASKIGPGLDIRGEGGYAVAPPSCHPNGEVYLWEPTNRPDELPLADAPDWLLALIASPPPAKVASSLASPGVERPAFLGRTTLDFIANGAPVGVQRMRAVAAARCCLESGLTPEQTTEKIWQGLQLSPADPWRAPWMPADAEKIVLDLQARPAPPLPEMDSQSTPAAAYRLKELELILCAAAYMMPAVALAEAAWLRPEMFTEPKTRQFWQVFTATQDKDHAAGESGTLAELLRWTPVVEPGNVAEYARQIATGQYLLGVSRKIPQLGLAVAAGDVANVRRVVSELHNDQPVTSTPAMTAIEGLAELEKIIETPGDRLLRTYLPSFDCCARGLELQTQSIWAARAGLGKTTLLSQIARNIAASKRTVLIFQLEMSAANWWGKAACGRVGLKWLDVLDDKLRPQQKVELRREIDKMRAEYEGWLYVDDCPQSTDTIWQAVAQYRPDFVMIDHLRLLKDAHENTVQRLGLLTSRLKMIAKQGHCHIATVHQIRRDPGEAGNRRPQLDDLRDSGLIEEDADAVFMLYRDSYYVRADKPQAYYDTELLPVKFRYDPDVTNGRIWLRYYPANDYYGERDIVPNGVGIKTPREFYNDRQEHTQ